MSEHSSPKSLPVVALLGNPNSGKSTIFNQLTGLRQKTGNFPGVTVDVKEGKITLPGGSEVMLTDLPGTYSLHPTASDEKIVTSVLTNLDDAHFPDVVLYVADATKLEKHLLLFTQLSDLGLPIVVALNMADTANDLGIKINTAKLSQKLDVPVVLTNGREGSNLDELTKAIEQVLRQTTNTSKPIFYTLSDTEKQITDAIRLNVSIENPYRALLVAHHGTWLPHLSEADRDTINIITQDKGFLSLRAQVDETLDRYDRFTPIVRDTIQQPPAFPGTSTDRIDAVITHRIGGPMLFFGVMILIFQAIFDWSAYPMDWIEQGFGAFNGWLRAILPASRLTDLLTDGILTGLSGILVFVPQIAILFFLITILEEVGYMARVVYMFDNMMRRFGMNGRSVVSLISGSACAVPAIMSSRTIGNWQERLITIFVTPFISCSARIPVYLVLIGLAVPATRIGGIISMQTLVFGGMYALGVFMAFAAGWAMKKWLGAREPSYLAIELPMYRMPHWRNVWLTVWEKTSAFVLGAGKIILIVSIALWALSSFGPGDAMADAVKKAEQEAIAWQLSPDKADDHIAQSKLEASFAGYIGHWMEPVIRPLGYDWKIGIALFTSFAAREVFTGTLAILYNLGSAAGDINSGEDNEAKESLRTAMRSAVFADTQQPVYTLATALSLLVFYALAMQCMSTMAVVRKETGGWYWAVMQFLLMSGLAYFFAWVTYNVFS